MKLKSIAKTAGPTHKAAQTARYVGLLAHRLHEAAPISLGLSEPHLNETISLSRRMASAVN